MSTDVDPVHFPTSVMTSLETARLWLKPMELGDADQIQALFPHWEILRLMSAAIPWPYPPDGALTWCRDSALPAMERGEGWYWTLRLKTDPDQVIGVISLTLLENNNRGFWMGLPWQGRGLMTEASEGVTDYWFNVLKFQTLRAPKAIANTPSRRISEKNGMRLVATEERDYVSGRLPSEIWEITADEWNQRRRRTG